MKRTPPSRTPDLEAKAERDLPSAVRDPLLTHTDNLRGALWMVLSCAGASGMMLAVRHLSQELDIRAIAFLRAALGLAAIIPIALGGKLGLLRFNHPWLHLLCGLCLAATLNLGFYAIAHLPLTTATTLFFLAPIYVTILASLFLKERVGTRRWSAVLAGFLGVLIILRPGIIPLNPGMIAAVASSAIFASSLMIMRKLSRADGSESVLISSTLVASIVLLPAALPVWKPLSNTTWLVLLLLGLSSSIRSYSDINAYRFGEAAFIAPFAYLRLVFVGIAGFLLFRETPDTPTLLGSCVIMGATLYISWREAQLRRRRDFPNERLKRTRTRRKWLWL